MTPDNQAPARPSEGLQVCPQCRVSPIEVTPGGIVFCDTCKLSVANRAAWIEMHRIAEGPRQAPSPGMLSAESIASYRALNTPRAPDPRPAAGDQERLAELRKTVATILDFVWTEKQMQQLLALIADQVHQAELKVARNGITEPLNLGVYDVAKSHQAYTEARVAEGERESARGECERCGGEGTIDDGPYDEQPCPDCGEKQPERQEHA